MNRCDRYLINGLAKHWAGQGLSAQARSAFAYAHCRTAEQVRALHGPLAPPAHL
jgi:hypothetical protein